MITPRNVILGFTSLFLLLTVSACKMDLQPVKGFVLPEGDLAKGELVFTKYGCNGCHTIPGVDLPELGTDPQILLEIGGEVYRVKNTGELLNSVITPNHVVSPEYVSKLKLAEGSKVDTPMPFYGDTMTVTELIDLVAFLRIQYSKLMPDFFESYLPEDMKTSG